MRSETNSLRDLILDKTPEEALTLLSLKFPDRISFSTSFSMEDQIISHLIFSGNLPIRVFTLDTGRFFPETYAVWNRTNQLYHQKIEVWFPNTESIQNLISEKGPFSFYESVENRKECCYIRKVEPLKRALQNTDCWITGIRSAHSSVRNALPDIEWDEANKLFKYHPLLNWTFEEVKDFIKEHHIPYNSLHDKEFPSIGCSPCTRAVKKGEDQRSGRWWWENTTKKECGLHTK